MKNYLIYVIIVILSQACQTKNKFIAVKGKQLYQIPKNFKDVDEQQAKNMLLNLTTEAYIKYCDKLYAFDGIIIGLRYNPENTSNGLDENKINKGIANLKRMYETNHTNVINFSTQTFNGQDFLVTNISNKDSYFMFYSNTKGGGYHVYGGVIRYGPNQQDKATKLLTDILQHINTTTSTSGVH